MPTAAALDAKKAIHVVTDGGVGFDGKTRNGMMDSADTVGLGQFDFGGNRKALATKYNLSGALVSETVGEYVIRSAFPELPAKDQAQLVLTLGTGLRAFVRDGSSDPDPLTDAQRARLSSYFRANPTVSEKLDEVIRNSFVGSRGVSAAIADMAALNWSDADMVIGAAFVIKTANQTGSVSLAQANYLNNPAATLVGLLGKVHPNAKDAIKAKDAAELLAALKESTTYSELYDAVVLGAQGTPAQIKSNPVAGLVFDAIVNHQSQQLASCIRAIDDATTVEPILFYYKGKLAVCDTENGTILLPATGGGYGVLTPQSNGGYSLTQQSLTLNVTADAEGSLNLSGGANLQLGTWFEGGIKVFTSSGKLLEIKFPEDVEVSSDLLTAIAKNASSNGANLSKWTGLKAVGASGELEVFVDGATTAVGTIKITSSTPKVVQGVRGKKTSFSVGDTDIAIDGNPDEVRAQFDADYEVERKDAQGNRIVDYVWEDANGEVTAARSLYFDAANRFSKFEYTNVDPITGISESEVAAISYVNGQPIFTGSVYTTGLPGSQTAEVTGYGLSTAAGGATGMESIKLVFGIGEDGQRVVESVLSINGIAVFSDDRMAADLANALNAIGVSERNFVEADLDESTYAVTEKIGALLSQVTVDSSINGQPKLIVPSLGEYEVEPEVTRHVVYELGAESEVTDVVITTSYENSGAVVQTHIDESSGLVASIATYESFGYTLSFSMYDGYEYFSDPDEKSILDLYSIDGVSLGIEYVLKSQDLAAYGITWSNILNNALPSSTEWLFEGLSSESQLENGWPSPQIHIQTLDDGGEIRQLLLGNGASFQSRYEADQTLTKSTVRKGAVQTETYFEIDGTTAVLTTVRNPLAGTVMGEAATYDANGLQTSFRQSEIRKQNDAANVTAQELQDQLFSGAADLLRSIRSKDKVGMLLTSAKLAADYARFNGNDTGAFDGVLKGTSAAIGVLGALHGLTSNNTLTQLNSALNLLNSANSLYARFNNNTGFITSDASVKLLGQIGAILSVANIVNIGEMLEHGQVGSAAFGAVNAINAIAYLGEATTTITNAAAGGLGGTVAATGEFAFIPMDPTTLAIMIVASIVLDELFSEDEEPPPPPPIGEAYFKRLSDGSLSYDIVNAANGGGEILAAKMDALLAKLNLQIGQANNGNTDPDLALALIASRMPKISLQSWPSKAENGISNFFFVLEYIHPQWRGRQ